MVFKVKTLMLQPNVSQDEVRRIVELIIYEVRYLLEDIKTRSRAMQHPIGLNVYGLQTQ